MSPRSGLRLGLALALAGFIAVPAAPAGTAGIRARIPAALCERAIVNGARRGGVPPEVLHAVALTETGRHRDGADAGLALGGQPRGQGLLVPEPRRRRWPSRRQSLAEGRHELRRRLRADQLPLARPRLSLGRGDVRPGMDRDLRGAVPAHALRGARQLVGGGRRLPLADARSSPTSTARASTGCSPDLDARGADRRRGAGRRGGARTARSARGQPRREAQRRAMAERIRAAGPPPEPGGGRHRRARSSCRRRARSWCRARRC